MRPLTTMVLPKNSGFQIGEMSLSPGCTGPAKLVEELAAVRVEERAVAVERAVLDRDRDLVVLGARRVAERAAPGRAARRRRDRRRRRAAGRSPAGPA